MEVTDQSNVAEEQNDAGATLPAVIITGASEGIGRAIAVEFSALYAGKGGRGLLLIARDGAALDALAEELDQKYRVRAIGLALDLVEPGAGQVIARRLAAAGWHGEILVNNAGVGLSGPFIEQGAEDIERLVRLNVEVPIALTRQFLPDMCRRGRGGVLNIASLGGYVPGPGQAAYYASKASLLSFSKAVGQEVRGTGVRITVVAPGPVETGFHAKMGASGARYMWVLPRWGPGWVAKVAVTGFQWGIRVVFPGPLTALLVFGARFTPNFILAPIMGWLLGGSRSGP